ncbi:MAG TPA: GNAT family N-acetyltransferase [Alphaproteobacteria bacterium]|nr:GNAT family N-acetyltransferase [Alphaproteobacteria bacterium]
MKRGRAGASRIRVGHAGDLASLEALERASFAGDRLSRRSFRSLLAAPSAALIVEETAGRVRGYALLLFRRRAPEHARLYSFAVAPGERGKGIAQSLLAGAERVALSRDASLLALEVRRDNKPAQALYAKAGFRATGSRADYYEDGMAAVVMEKRLGRTDASRTRRRVPAAKRMGDR